MSKSSQSQQKAPPPNAAADHTMPDGKRETLFRIQTAIGHLAGVEKMIASDTYCIDILKQLAAVQAALAKIGGSLSERHMQQCVLAAVKEGRGEEKIEELMNTLKYLKHF